MKLKQLLTTLAAAVGITTAATAATPVAVWDGGAGDFEEAKLAKEGYTLSLNENAASDGIVTMTAGKKGLKIAWTGSTNPFGTDQNTTFVQVLVRYSDLTAPTADNTGRVLVSLSNSVGGSGDYLGTCVIKDGVTRGIWGGNSGANRIYANSASGTMASPVQSGKANFVYSYTRGTPTGVNGYVDGSQAYGNSGLRANYTVKDIYIGGSANASDGNFAVCEGMKIYGIAVFTSAMTAAEMAEYRFPSEIHDYATTVTGDANFSELTWTPEKPEGGFDEDSFLTINNASTATVTIDEALTAAELAVAGEGATTLAKGDVAVSVATYDFSGATGDTAVSFDTGASSVISGTDTVLAGVSDPILTIASDNVLTVKSGSLKEEKTTNNGTLNFDGGTADSPIIYDTKKAASDPGTMTIASGAYMRAVTYNNKKGFVVTGAGADVSTMEIRTQNGGQGMPSNARIRGVKLVVSNFTGNNALWLESTSECLDASVDLVVDSNVKINVAGLTVGAVSGAGAIQKGGSGALTVTPSTDATFSGACSEVAFTLAGTAVQTISGNYTAALTVNGSATAKLAGSANPSAITDNGTVKFGGTADKTYANVISGTGAVIKEDDNTVTFAGANTYEGGTTVKAGTLAISTGTIGTGFVTIDGGAIKFTITDEEAEEGVTLFSTTQDLAGIEDSITVVNKAGDTVPGNLTKEGDAVKFAATLAHFTANITGDVTWSTKAGLSDYGSWVSSPESTITLTNTIASATVSFDETVEAKVLKIVSTNEPAQATVIPYASFANLTVAEYEFSEALGGVQIDFDGASAEEILLVSGKTIVGTDNITAKNAPAGTGIYVTADGISLRKTANTTYANPVVTTEEKTFNQTFFGTTDATWDTLANWRKAEGGLWIPATVVPGKQDGGYGPLVLDGNMTAEKTITAAQLEGWTPQYALYNGMTVTVTTLNKMQTNNQGFIWVDDSSSITFNTSGGNNHGTLALAVANDDGVTFTQKWSAGDNTISYYLTGDGSVNYAAGVSAGTHKIAQLDVDVGDTAKTAKSVVKGSALVKFGATSSVTFGAADDITAKSSDPSVTPVYTNVAVNATMPVGTYTIVTEEDGVYAYVVQASDTWDIVDPLVATLAEDKAFGSITWTDACGNDYATPADAHAFELTAGEYTATFDDKVVAGSSIALKSGTLEVATADIVTNATLTINEDAMLSVKASGLVTGKVTNNGTIAFAGGTEETPIAITGNSEAGTALGKWELGEGTYVKETLDGVNNLVYNINGAGAATSFFEIGRPGNGYGFSDGGVLSNLTLVVAADANQLCWVERNALLNDTVNVEVKSGSMYLYGCSPTIGSLSGNGIVSGGNPLTITPGAEATYTGTSSVPFVISGTAKQTLSGVYTGVLTVNVGATAAISGEAMPSSIANSGTLDMNLASEWKLVTDNNGTINLGDNDIVVMEGVEDGTINTTGTGKVYYGFVMDINDCGRFELTGGLTADNVKLYDGTGTEIAFTDKGTYLEFDWGITDGNCWWDYEFNGNLTSTGTDTGTMTAEGTTPYYNEGETALRVGYGTPWRNASYPEEFTAVIYGKMVNTSGHMEIGFGSTTSGTQYGVVIACGDPAKNEVNLHITSAKAIVTTVPMTVTDPYDTDHLYAFTCQTITEGETEKTKVSVYLDGKFLQAYTFGNKITLGSGFQVGSIHGGSLSGCIKATTANDHADLDFLRVYQTVLTAEAMTKYAEKYPYTSKSGSSVRTFDDSLDQTWVAAAADKVWTVTPFEETAYTTNIALAGSTVTVSAPATAEVTMNLTEATTYESLTIGEGSDITFKTGDEAVEPTVTGVTTIKANVTVDYDAIRFGTVEVAAEKTLTFDFTDFPFTSYYASATIAYTGATSGEGTIAATGLPTEGVRTVTFEKNASTDQYELKITVDTTIPFIYTIGAAEETGTWTFGDTEPVTQEIVDAYPKVAIWKKGDGSMTNVVINRTYFVKEGTMVAGNAKDKTGTVTVEADATFDFNGKADGFITVNLNGGSLVNNGGEMGTGSRQLNGIALTEDSTIGGTGNFGLISGGWGANTLNLGGKSLTKIDSNTFWLTHTTVTNGTLNVTGGTIKPTGSEVTFTSDAALVLTQGTTLDNATTLNIGAITANEATINNTGTITAFTLTGTATLTGNGNWGTNTLDNATIDVGNLRNLPLEGTGTVDVQLTAEEYSQYVAITVFTTETGTISFGTVKDAEGNTLTKDTDYTVADGTITPVDKRVAITSISIPETLEVAVGATNQIELTVLPENASTWTAVWQAYGDTIDVDKEGNVAGLAAGEGLVQVTVTDVFGTDFIAQCTVTVTAPGPTYPSWLEGAGEANIAKYYTWASNHGVSDPSAAMEDAFLLNCDNTTEAVNAAKALFKITSITIDGDDVAIEYYAPEGGYNGTVKIMGATVLSTNPTDWHEKTTGDQFFQASLELIPANE